MVLNRLECLRILKLVKSVDVNEVKFDAEGRFGVSSEDGSCLLFGPGLKLGQEVGFMDLGMFEKMMNGLSELDINVEFKDGLMTISGAKTVFGYRLGQPELITGYPVEKEKEFEAGGIEGKEVSYEDLDRINSLIKTLGVDKVSFVEEGGELVVLVGDRKLFYGQVRLEGVGLKKEKSFRADRLRRILDVVDAGKIGLEFGVGEKGFLRLTAAGYRWYVGELVG